MGILFAKLGSGLVDVLDFPCALRPGKQAFLDHTGFKRWFSQFTPDNEVILKDGVFQVRALGVTRQFDRNVFVVLAFITDACLTVFSYQSIKISPCSNTAFDDLLDQVLFELAVLSVEIIALVTRQNTGRVGDVRTDIITRRRQAILLVNVLLNGFKVFLMILVDINRISLIATEQVDTRNDNMYMRLAINDLTGFPVSDGLHFRQVRFGIQVEFFRLVRMHEELLEVSRHCLEQFR
ncbi:hypothetical protein [Pseudomonas savastanoi]|uniref:hypothetical protein n=1 Tax=Pseudomonas savastanoi TaxID=29438 RepID=UPI0001F707A4|nr:hypothetical protein PsgB076_29125 [Pseudomonas savastanoi pv. glycinea str. B076]